MVRGRDARGDAHPTSGILERYEPDANAGAWTLTVKPGLKWHDGVELTATDLKFSVEAYAQRGICTQHGVLKAKLDRVEIVDRSTAILHLHQPEVNIPAIFGPLEGDLLELPPRPQPGAAGGQ